MKLLNIIKHYILKKKEPLTESEFYEDFFTKNPYWSSKKPNAAELERWEHITELIKLTSKQDFKQIIDFGCGRGWLTQLLTKYGKSLGIEPVGKVVNYGKKIYPGLDIRTGSCEVLAEMKADLIVCSEVIEHVETFERADYIKAFWDATQSNGYLIITTPRAEVWDEWYKHSPPGQPVENWLWEDELITMCTKQGFQHLSVRRYSERPQNGPMIEVYQLHLFHRPSTK